MNDSVDERIVSLCNALDTASSEEQTATWKQLQEYGPSIVPHLAQSYFRLKKWQGRVAVVFHLIQYVPGSKDAFRVAIATLRDRSRIVRYRACMLLARAGRLEAVPALKELLTHHDKRTIEDATAAIDAIEQKNPNFFIDRMHTGRLIWVGNQQSSTPFDANGTNARTWWAFWRRRS